MGDKAKTSQSSIVTTVGNSVTLTISAVIHKNKYKRKDAETLVNYVSDDSDHVEDATALLGRIYYDPYSDGLYYGFYFDIIVQSYFRTVSLHQSTLLHRQPA